jgi:hypothetical protein
MVEESMNSVWKRTLVAARPHLILLGEVVHASSLLQDSFFRVFALAISLERPDEFGAGIRFHGHTLAIWHSIQSDQQQREMAFAAITSVPTTLNLRPLIERIKWAKKHATEMSGYRNLVAHNPVMFSGKQKGKRIHWEPSFGGYSTRPLHQQKLKLIADLRLWRTLRNDLLNLSKYVDALFEQGRRLDVESRGAELVGVPKTWPKRPQLRSLPRLKAIDLTLSPASRSAKRRTRRGASRRSP